jgi:hypothetical protein
MAFPTVQRTVTRPGVLPAVQQPMYGRTSPQGHSRTAVRTHAWEAFTSDVEERLEAENQTLREYLRQSLLAGNTRARREVQELQHRINRMRSALEAYDPEDTEAWVDFRREFSYDVESIGQSIQELTGIPGSI